MYRWQLLMTTTRKQSYRPYTKQQLDFGSLETPVTDAVIGLDRTGSFVFAIGDEQEANHNNSASDSCCILLKAFGLPSPAVIQQAARNEAAGSSRTCTRPVSPLLWTAPLRFERSLFGDRIQRSPLIASFQFELILSSDGRIGVAIVYGPFNESGICTSVSFLISLNKTQLCNNLPVPLNQVLSVMRTKPEICSNDVNDKLWQVSCLPVKDGASLSSTHFRRKAGYILMRDSRFISKLSFFGEAGSKCDERLDDIPMPLRSSRQKFAPSNEEAWCHPLKDTLWQNMMPKCDRLDMVCEMLLVPHCLVSHIMSLHPKLVAQGNPCLNYVVTGVREGGRMLEMVFLFVVPDENFFTSVVILLDLFTRGYEESEWTKHALADPTHACLAATWKSYMINRQMQTRGIGPYCVDPSSGLDWSHLVKDHLTELHSLSDFDREVWSAVVEQATASSPSGPETLVKTKAKHVSSMSLYPDSYELNNRAILTQSPVFTMEAIAGPVKLVYMDDESADMM
ncbi:hypothetical protein MPSEU_000172400 [Mayamaea pseudoterrestris]|nr:hypothetical protein MPSEU_000172400 [Mayamaea pseudoterrestris]